MRKTMMMGMVLAASASLAACTSYDRYGDNRQVERAATGAAIGAAGGAAVGAVVDGVSPVEGAVAGAVAGGVIGAVTGDSNRRWYRDDRGYCYWVDNDGRRRYDYDKRC